MVNETKLVRRYLPYKLMLILLIVTLTAVAAVSLSWGRFPVPMEGVWLSLLQQNPDDVQQNVVLNLRLPRVLAAVLVGAALSAAGTAYQGIFRNPLVSPDLRGFQPARVLVRLWRFWQVLGFGEFRRLPLSEDWRR